MKKSSLLLSALLMTNVCVPMNLRFGVNHKIGPVNVGISRQESISGQTLLIAACTILAAKIAYDVSWHNTYATQASNMYQQLDNAVQSNQVTSVTDSALLTLSDQVNCDNVLIYQSWIHNSYNSWFCPWNWTASQKHALNQLKVVEVLTMYADLMALSQALDGAITSSNVSQIFRTKFMSISLYPLVYSAHALQNSINFIASSNHSFCGAKINALLQDMIPYLVRFQNLLRQDKDYILELQMKRMHDLQQETIDAINSQRFY